MSAETFPLVVITGLSGSGISTALDALEDLGYFCVDNLPPPLIPRLIALAHGTDKLARLAIGLDARNVDDARKVIAMLDDLRADGAASEVLFIEATDAVLLRRFSTTRRRHPLGEAKGLPAAIAEERSAMHPFREIAGRVIDTSDLNVHQLKKRIQERVSKADQRQGAAVSLLSFGFRYGVPAEADIVWDVRFLPNPHFVPELRPNTGLNLDVQRYVLDQPATIRFLDRFVPLLDDVLPSYDAEGKSYLTVAIGCTGGRHRSVSIVEHLADHLNAAQRQITVRHRDIDKESK